MGGNCQCESQGDCRFWEWQLVGRRVEECSAYWRVVRGRSIFQREATGEDGGLKRVLVGGWVGGIGREGGDGEVQDMLEGL